MLYIKYTKPKYCIESNNMLFDGTYMDKWFQDKEVQLMIKTVDLTNVEKVGAYLQINSPFLGIIAPERLSGGVKGLICLKMLANDEIIKNKFFYSAKFGNNCYPWIYKMAEKQDILLYRNSAFKLPRITGKNRYKFEDTFARDYGDYVYQHVNLETGKLIEGYHNCLLDQVLGSGGEWEKN